MWLRVLLLSLVGLSQPMAAYAYSKSQIENRLWRVERMLEQQDDILFKHIKALQDEVSELRQMLEDQQYQYNQLKKQSIKKVEHSVNKTVTPETSHASNNLLLQPPKITQISESSNELQASKNEIRAMKPERVVTNQPSPQSPKKNTTYNFSDEEKNTYQAAYKLIKERNFSQAIVVFKDYLKRYPQGGYVPNAYYWMGEVYMLENHVDDASKSFETVVKRFPKHNKAADSLFKLAMIFVKQKQNDQAKIYFERVRDQYPQSGAANLASDRLKTL